MAKLYFEYFFYGSTPLDVLHWLKTTVQCTQNYSLLTYTMINEQRKVGDREKSKMRVNKNKAIPKWFKDPLCNNRTMKARVYLTKPSHFACGL